MLTDEQLVTVAEIAQETFETVDDLAGSLNAAQEAYIVEKLDRWAEVQSFVTMKQGGKYKISNDEEDERRAIRRDVRNALGLSLDSPQIYGPGSLVIEHTAVW